MKRIIIATLLFLFPVALSVWDIQEKIEEQAPSLGPYLGYVPWISFGLLALFVLLIALETIGLIIEAFYRLQPSTLANVASRPARAVDIPRIVGIAQGTMGARITEENTLLLYNHNSKCIRKVVDTRTDEIIGYFCILPLTVNGERSVMERDLINDDLDIGNFAKRFRRGVPVYIGSMAGVNTRGRAATLELAKVVLADLETSKAFTRPVTKDGVRLVKKFGFKPVNEHDALTSNVYVVKIREVF